MKKIISKRTASALILGLCVLDVPSADALTGEEYVNLPTLLRVSYVAGTLDGLQKMLDDERRTQIPSDLGMDMKRYFSCFQSWGNDEYRKALDDHFVQEEDRLEYGAATALLEVMERLCPE